MSKLHWAAIKSGVSKHSPQILTAIAIIEIAATVYLAVKATPKAEQLINKAQEKKGEKLTPTEVVKTTWKCYIPAATVGVCAITTVIGANSIVLRRNAALATMGQLTETAFQDYRNKVSETIGEKKEEAIRDAVAQDYISRHPIDETKIINTGEGMTLFKDWASGQEFRHDRVKLEKACNRLNQRMLSENCVSLNDYYAEIGLDDIGVGDNLGWNIDRDGLIELKFGTTVASNDEPCFLIYFGRAPKYDYRW